jgi:hypothetical protein
MVRAILAGRKTQTRRLVKMLAPKKSSRKNGMKGWQLPDGSIVRLPDGDGRRSPYGTPGDRLWVREAYAVLEDDRIIYQADAVPGSYGAALLPDGDNYFGPWRTPLFMPRTAARLVLEVEAVRVERLHDISERDAIQEGVTPECGQTAVQAFEFLWDMIHGPKKFKSAPGAWDSNPLVWCVAFKRAEQ